MNRRSSATPAKYERRKSRTRFIIKYSIGILVLVIMSLMLAYQIAEHAAVAP